MDGAVLAFTIGLLILIVVGNVLVVPLKYVVKFVANGVLGGILLWLVNLVGAGFSLHVPINIVTALIAGFLGIPGVIMLIGLRLILA
ncbi:pro-sigmaK processing inhibitor BofA [Thermincola ferriacetica]|uniref:Pro-sigmaK processing inhibitor BofA n=2 Tax=Thermincola TaxID=278993 RepID=D5X8X0_THEPJ|nr:MULTISPECIES: pro-sigmaK processing inhibitor BofA family protein [Thermincola]ADG80970.1 pro-sigmaK processing inhibitor BofA [Thermincola potens JR]KNZ68797.1 pro-sigmaK processing inhibitor BofA [Thermincola ferriacetica]